MAEFFKPRDVVHVPRKGKRERLATGGAAIPLSASVYTIPAVDPGTGYGTYTAAKVPTAAFVQVLTAAVNFTIDGTTPTASVGFLAQPGDVIFLNRIQEIVNFQAIENAAPGAIEVQYFYGY